MAAGTIIALLSSVPWRRVLKAAPEVAESATRLWNAVSKRTKQEAGAVAAHTKIGGTPQSLTEVQAQVITLQDSVDALKDEMQAATELIKALAEQNTQLVQRIELHRRRLKRLTVSLALTGVGLAIGVVYFILRS